MKHLRWLLLLPRCLLLLGVLSCAEDASTQPTPKQPPPTVFGGDRPVELFVPSGYDASVPTPLVILLHGHGASGIVQEILFQLEPHAEAHTVLYAHPDGTTSEEGKRFWNATEACCDFFGSGTDDSAYLRALVEEIAEHYNVDDRRIYFTGHSNGSFMSFRMACDHADLVAGIAGLAGAFYADGDDCGASELVHVLHIHGTQDNTVDYNGFAGDEQQAPYASANESVAYWAALGGCQGKPSDAPAIDLDRDLTGAETLVSRYGGCKAGASAELWTIRDGRHLPSFGPNFSAQLMTWLLARAKP